MLCVNCNTETGNPKFCSKSCAAKYNNKSRVRTEASKRRTSEAVKKALKGQSKIMSERSKAAWNKPDRKRQRRRDRLCTVCGCKITFENKYEYCKEHWILSDEFQEHIANYARFVKGYVYNVWEGSFVYLLSQLEFDYYDFLSEERIEWRKPAPLQYITEDGKSHFYFPDFYLVKSKVYTELKGYMWNNDAIKLQLVKEQHPEITLEILSRKDVDNLINVESSSGRTSRFERDNGGSIPPSTSTTLKERTGGAE